MTAARTQVLCFSRPQTGNATTTSTAGFCKSYHRHSCSSCRPTSTTRWRSFGKGCRADGLTWRRAASGACGALSLGSTQRGMGTTRRRARAARSWASPADTVRTADPQQKPSATACGGAPQQMRLLAAPAAPQFFILLVDGAHLPGRLEQGLAEAGLSEAQVGETGGQVRRGRCVGFRSFQRRNRDAFECLPHIGARHLLQRPWRWVPKNRCERCLPHLPRKMLPLQQLVQARNIRVRNT
mmetsp:Transcript_26410/g.66397  ORF Transcript_26410/g.66397 Transcript_26410/m.66397 type:complete len:240 (+) Transcript_26410:368-1087(+)